MESLVRPYLGGLTALWKICVFCWFQQVVEPQTSTHFSLIVDGVNESTFIIHATVFKVQTHYQGSNARTSSKHVFPR